MHEHLLPLIPVLCLPACLLLLLLLPMSFILHEYISTSTRSCDPMQSIRGASSFARMIFTNTCRPCVGHQSICFLLEPIVGQNAIMTVGSLLTGRPILLWTAGKRIRSQSGQLSYRQASYSDTPIGSREHGSTLSCPS